MAPGRREVAARVRLRRLRGSDRVHGSKCAVGGETEPPSGLAQRLQHGPRRARDTRCRWDQRARLRARIQDERHRRRLTGSAGLRSPLLLIASQGRRNRVRRPAKCPAEFCRELVALVKRSGRPVAEGPVARVAEGASWNWEKADRERAARDPDPHPTEIKARTGTWEHGKAAPGRAVISPRWDPC